MIKAIFLDRDGVINIDHGYVHTKETFDFNPGIFQLLQMFQAKGYWLFVVTNQSGIARGYYTHEDFQRLTHWMLQRFKEQGITIDAVEYCPHGPDEGCQCRKPNTGMIQSLQRNYPIDLSKSWFIGDKPSDIACANNANIPNTIHLTPSDLTTTNTEVTLRCQTLQDVQHFFQTNQY